MKTLLFLIVAMASQAYSLEKIKLENSPVCGTEGYHQARQKKCGLDYREPFNPSKTYNDYHDSAYSVFYTSVHCPNTKSGAVTHVPALPCPSSHRNWVSHNPEKGYVCLRQTVKGECRSVYRSCDNKDKPIYKSCEVYPDEFEIKTHLTKIQREYNDLMIPMVNFHEETVKSSSKLFSSCMIRKYNSWSSSNLDNHLTGIYKDVHEDSPMEPELSLCGEKFLSCQKAVTDENREFCSSMDMEKFNKLDVRILELQKEMWALYNDFKKVKSNYSETTFNMVKNTKIMLDTLRVHNQFESINYIQTPKYCGDDYCHESSVYRNINKTIRSENDIIRSLPVKVKFNIRSSCDVDPIIKMKWRNSSLGIHDETKVISGNYEYEAITSNAVLFSREPLLHTVMSLGEYNSDCELEVTSEAAIIDYSILNILISSYKDNIRSKLKIYEGISETQTGEIKSSEILKNISDYDIVDRMEIIQFELEFLGEYESLSEDDQRTYLEYEEELSWLEDIKLAIDSSIVDNSDSNILSLVRKEIESDKKEMLTIVDYLEKDRKRLESISNGLDAELEKFISRLKLLTRSIDSKLEISTTDAAENADKLPNDSIVKLEMRGVDFNWPNMDWKEHESHTGFWSSRYTDGSREPQDMVFGTSFMVYGVTSGFLFERDVEQSNYGFGTGGFTGTPSGNNAFYLSGIAQSGYNRIGAHVSIKHDFEQENSEEKGVLYLTIVHPNGPASGVESVRVEAEKPDESGVFFFNLSDIDAPQGHTVTMTYVLPKPNLKFTLYRAELVGVSCRDEVYENYPQHCE